MNLKTLAALAVGLLSANIALAIPTLQLDIDGGTYVGGSEESTATNNATFDLWALGDTSSVNTSLDYYLSIALLPQTKNVGDIANLGGVTVNGATLSTLSGNAEYGTPPIENISKGGELAPHGVFETYYYQLMFSFSDDPTIASYNVQDGSLGPANDELFKHVFQIDASALASGYGLHFDLYTYGGTNNKRTAITEFAPFSHDAAYCIGLKCEPIKVTEPSSLALFGIGLMGLVAVRRRLRLRLRLRRA
ncbi:choice-of-anchor N protein [Marinobacter sp.]|uniref:choice-of-anchor N protein n=1 Tax=Marinobacter sp. TaxID=50741 RepID=UPI0019CA2376|nr:choice-of-anchor N protein [Marinobacter sp.]MBC7191685.1 choice-of-anchor N protein [Marinobacter sp.]